MVETLVTDDRALVGRAQAGDPRALEALLLRHAPMVRRLGRRFSASDADAEDVLQDTLFTAARSIGAFEGRAAFSTWLYTIARSHAAKRRRGRLVGAPTVSFEGSPEMAALPDESEPVEDAAARHELGEALGAALGELDDVSREVVWLRDVEGMTAPEVSDALGLGLEAVKSRLHRARARLRSAMEPWAVTQREGCPDVVSLFSRHLEGEIDADACAAMQRHVDGCSRCSDACDSLRRTLAACRRADADGIDEGVQAKVREALARVQREIEGGRRLR